ncbi:MAG: hypothetical protein KBA61_00110 [Spirochaetes bacterium]|nr:hypothetical protein [Spirochaetota bacterium]
MEPTKKNFIPQEIISQFEKEIAGVSHGSIKLEIIRHGGRFARYTITREISFLPSDCGGKK